MGEEVMLTYCESVHHPILTHRGNREHPGS